MKTDTYSERRAARLAEIDLALAETIHELTSVDRLLLLYEAMALCQAQGNETWRERYQAPARLLVEEGHTRALRVQSQLPTEKRKPTEAQVAILAAMAQGNLSLRVHTAQGNVAPFYPTRMAWVESPTNARLHRSVLPATIDGLIVRGLICEKSRAVSGTATQGEYRWINWETTYELTERARAYLTNKHAEPK